MAEAFRARTTISHPSAWTRAITTCVIAAVSLAWISGLIHALLPIDRVFDREALERADAVIPAALALAAAAVASTFTRITVRPGKSLKVVRRCMGFPFVHEYSREQIRCLSAEYSDPGILERMLTPAHRRLEGCRDGRKVGGTSHLYVVLTNGGRIRIYKGQNDYYLRSLAAWLEAGLGLKGNEEA